MRRNSNRRDISERGFFGCLALVFCVAFTLSFLIPLSVWAEPAREIIICEADSAGENKVNREADSAGENKVNREADSANEDEVVRVGYYENEIFEEGAEEGAVKTGYAYEYYCKISEYTGWRYEYVYGGFSEIYEMFLNGEVDLIAGLAYREEREDLMLYPNEIMGSESYYLVKHDSDRDTSADPATLQGKKIGVLDSAMVGVLNQYLEEHGVDAEVIIYPEHNELFEDFDSQKIDILMAESDGAYGREHAEVLCAIGNSDYYLCVTKSRPDLLEELNSAQALLAAEEPHYINDLSAKYYSVSVTALAFSNVERDWMDTHEALKVGYLENYLPYSDTDDKGEVTGMLRDITPEILESLGLSNINVTYTGYKSYDDMVEALNEGTIDTAFPVGGGLYYSEENGIYQSNPAASSPTEIIYKGEYNDDTTTHFAVNENNRMQYYYVCSNYPDAEITLYPSIDDCLMAVLDGKATCTTLNGLRANDILRNSKYSDLSMHNSNKSDDRCFGVRIGNEGLLKLLNRGVSILGTDYIQNTAYHYTEGLYSYTFRDFVRNNQLVIATVFVALVILTIALLVRNVRRTKKQVMEKEAASRAKTAFLNNMSHDIRTPMNAIVGFTALAQSHIDSKDMVKDYLAKISVSSQHLLSLINDVLDMSRIESGNVTIEEAGVYLPNVIKDVRAIIQPNVAPKNLELTVDTEGIVHENIICDKLRLNQILLNILSNAIKFTPEKGKISFKVTEKESEKEGCADYIFVIKDNGIGMSEEFQKTIFEAFSREKTSTVTGIQGTGLGMAITKNIVDMMNGTIEVKSEEGKGSEFTVRIPFKISDTPVEELAVEKKIHDFSGKRVLLAEDNEMNQMIAAEILKETGFEIEIAGTGKQAVEMVANADPGYYDIILMDIQMPEMDGYEATRTIRAMEDPVKAKVPIVAVTANAFEEDRDASEKAGMDGHLAKPYDIPAIMETLRRLIK